MRQQKSHNLQLEVVEIKCINFTEGKWRLVCKRVNGYSRCLFHINVTATADFSLSKLDVRHPFNQERIGKGAVITVKAVVKTSKDKEYAYLSKPQYSSQVSPVSTQEEHQPEIPMSPEELLKLSDELQELEAQGLRLRLSNYSEVIPSECFPC